MDGGGEIMGEECSKRRGEDGRVIRGKKYGCEGTLEVGG